MHLLIRILLSLMGQNKGSNDSFAVKTQIEETPVVLSVQFESAQ